MLLSNCRIECVNSNAFTSVSYAYSLESNEQLYQIIQRYNPDTRFIDIQYINLKTGDIKTKTEIPTPEQGGKVKFLSPKQLQGIRDKNQKRNLRGSITKEKIFIACKEKSILKISDRLSVQTATHLMKLIVCVTLESKGILVNEKGSPLSNTEIMKILSLSRAQTSRVLKELLDIKIILSKPNPKDERKKIYSLNPIYHSIGKQINESFTKLFRLGLETLIKDNKIGNELGAFYKMIPHFHKQTSFLCKNPDDDIRVDKSISLIENLKDCEKREIMVAKIQHMQQKELANAIGVDPSTMNLFIDKLENLGVAKRSTLGESVIHMIHPDFLSKQDDLDGGAYKAVISFMFEAHKGGPTRKSGRKPQNQKKKNRKERPAKNE